MTPDGIDELCICHEHKPVCDCRPVVDPAQIAGALTDSQFSFLRFMGQAGDYIAEWRHLMKGAQVLATTSKGAKRYMATRELDLLLALGFVSQGYGGSYQLTDKGRTV